MMSEETRQWVRRVFGLGLGIAADALKDEGEDAAAAVLKGLAPGLVEKILDEIVDESVEVKVGKDASATGDVVFR